MPQGEVDGALGIAQRNPREDASSTNSTTTLSPSTRSYHSRLVAISDTGSLTWWNSRSVVITGPQVATLGHDDTDLSIAAVKSPV